MPHCMGDQVAQNYGFCAPYNFAHMDRANTRAVLVPFCDASRVLTVCEKFDDLKTT